MMMVRKLGSMAALALAAAACSETTLEPGVQPGGELTVNAAADWAFVSLGHEAQQVQVADRSASSAWDIAFFATGVMLNGGAAGPAGVEGYCLCQNAGATNAQLLAMTPENQQAAFEAVTASSIPTSEDAWQTDVLSPAIAGWYSYDFTTHQVSANPARVWKIRLAESTNPGYAKFHVIDIDGGTQTSAGQVTIEYAVQTAGGAAMGATQTAVLDGSSGRVYFDFARGEVSDASDWDIALDGWDILINGGVSGSGRAGAVLASQTFAEMTDASDMTASHYRGDAYGGVFDEHRWYRYNLTGSHDITPTFDVYLIRRGTAVYKVQLTSYYNVEGDARHITFRYEQIAE